MKSVSIIGLGRLGSALAIALSGAGFRLDVLCYRSKTPPVSFRRQFASTARFQKFDKLTELNSDIVFITTSDADITTAASSIGSFVKPSCIVFHTSGALSSDILEPLANIGQTTGSIHPLVSVSDPERAAEAFSGSYFCVEGMPIAVSEAKGIVHAIGGFPFEIATRFKPLYHASAVMASGHLVALFETVIKCLERCDVDAEMGKQIMFPLVESTLNNLRLQDANAAMTGPFARVDKRTIELHLNALHVAGLENERMIYIYLGQKALEIAANTSKHPEKIDDVRKAILIAKELSK